MGETMLWLGYVKYLIVKDVTNICRKRSTSPSYQFSALAIVQLAVMFMDS